MNTAFKPLSWILFWSATAGIAVGGLAAAQEPPPTAPSSDASQPAPATKTPAATSKSPPKSTAQIDAGEPRASTSPPSPGAASGTTSAASGPTAGAPAGGTPAAGKPDSRTQPVAGAPKAAGQKPGGVDRLQLNTATVTGDREQPKVMYIVPWKSSDIGDLSGKPMNSLLDEALAPVDRDEFKREVVYFEVVKADRSQNGTSGPAAKQGEK
jgi:hypothetical protein